MALAALVILALAPTAAHARYDPTSLAPKASGRARAHKTAGFEFLRNKAQEDGVVLHPDTGLLYRVLREGPPDAPSPDYDTPCDCHYKGSLIDGTVFDDSHARGRGRAPATFAPNEVIQGWREALPLMKEGDEWELYLPSAKAYGDRGAGKTIPGGATLVFQIELVKVRVGESALGGDVIRVLMAPVFLFIRVWHLVGVGAFVVFRAGAHAFGWGVKQEDAVKARCAKETRAAASHVLVASDGSGPGGPQAQAARHSARRDACAELRRRIDAGTLTFEQAAEKHSACPSGARDGGYLGWFGPGKLAPALDALVFTAATGVGEVLGPVETPFGWHLLRVEGRERLPGEWPLFPKPTAVGKLESPPRFFERPPQEDGGGGGGANGAAAKKEQ